MAREIVVWCDVHLAKDERKASSMFSIALDGRAREVDLCPECEADLVAPLRAVLEEFGVRTEPGALLKQTTRRLPPPSRAVGTETLFPTDDDSGEVRKGRTPSRGRDYQCVFCTTDYASPSGWVRHLRTQHGVATLPEAYGPRCPACGGHFASLGSHVGQAHKDEFRNPTEAFAWATQNGDPHGVVAERLEWVKGRTPLPSGR